MPADDETDADSQRFIYSKYSRENPLPSSYETHGAMSVATCRPSAYAREMRKILPILLITYAGLASAEIYRYIDAEGNVSFSNEPPPGVKAERVDLPPPNTITSDVPEITPPAPKSNSKAVYTGFSIAQPENDAPLRDNAGNVSVSIDLAPALRPSDTIYLYLDGTEVAKGATTRFELTNVDRGTHQLWAEVKNQAGDTLIKSNAITFHLLRVSVLTNPINRPTTPPAP